MSSPSVPSLAVIFIAGIGLISACVNAPVTSESAPKVQPTNSPIYSSSITRDYFTLYSLKEVTDYAEIIVTGRFSEKLEMFNGARLPGDTTKTDPNVLGLMQTYSFEVGQYIKGDGPSEIRVAQAEGFLTGKDVGITLTDENIQKARDGYYHNSPPTQFYPDWLGGAGLKRADWSMGSLETI